MPTAASQTSPELSTLPSTLSFAQKPMNGGTPAMLNMIISVTNANHGLRAFKPLKSSSRSASKPARESRMIMPNAAAAISTYANV